MQHVINQHQQQAVAAGIYNANAPPYAAHSLIQQPQYHVIIYCLKIFLYKLISVALFHPTKYGCHSSWSSYNATTIDPHKYPTTM